MDIIGKKGRSWVRPTVSTAGCPKKILFRDDFSDGFDPSSPYSPFYWFTVQNPDGSYFVADDTSNIVAEKGSLQLFSVPFTKTRPDGLDHTKALTFVDGAFQAPDAGELVVSTVLSSQQTGNSLLPDLYKARPLNNVVGVSNANSDPRPAWGALNFVDFATMMVFDFVITNEDIYALYERLPFLRTEWGGPGPNYLAFTHLIPLGKRNQVNPGQDYTSLAIKYNKSEGYVRWMINGQEMFRVNRIGFPLERKYRVLQNSTSESSDIGPELVVPQSLSAGFGNFSLMDAYAPQNPGQLSNTALLNLTLNRYFPYNNPVVTSQTGEAIQSEYIAPYSPEMAIWGQGNILRLRYLEVSVERQVNPQRE